jgi:hypothetical protein
MIMPLLQVVAFLIFVFFFWLNWGFFLGGDSTILGPRIESMEVVFPLFGVGILIAFFSNFSQYFKKRILIKSPQLILFFCIFLSVFTILSLFSFQPKTSIVFVILWAISVFSTMASNTFFVQKKWQKISLLLGILLGIFIARFFPEIRISKDLIAAAAILTAIFFAKEEDYFLKIFLPVMMAGVIFWAGNFGIIIFAIFIFWTSKIWGREFRKRGTSPLFLPTILLLGATIYAVINNHFSISLLGNFPFQFFKIPLNLFFGAGEGQFFVIMSNFSAEFLRTSNFVFPQSGLFVSLVETGILGVLFTTFFIFSPQLFGKQKSFFYSVLFFGFWILSPEFFNFSNGILFSSVFLFAQQGEGKNYL